MTIYIPLFHMNVIHALILMLVCSMSAGTVNFRPLYTHAQEPFVKFATNVEIIYQRSRLPLQLARYSSE